MALYRIITENVNKQGIIEIITKYIDGFTLIDAQGYWRGKPEDALIIEIEVVLTGQSTIYSLAKDIKKLNNQESVLIQKIETKSHFV